MAVCAKDAAKYPTMGRTALHHLPTRKRIVWPQMSLVPRLKSLSLKMKQSPFLRSLPFLNFLLFQIHETGDRASSQKRSTTVGQVSGGWSMENQRANAERILLSSGASRTTELVAPFLFPTYQGIAASMCLIILFLNNVSYLPTQLNTETNV